MNLEGRPPAVQFLVWDRDASFSGPFNTVLRPERMQVIRTPFRAPNANAHAERVTETIRAECLDWTLGLATPLGVAKVPVPVSPRDVRRRDLLGGLIREYYEAAA